MEYKPGSIVSNGRYIIHKELNRGGTAVVYEAKDVTQNIKVALKVMHSKEGIMSVPVKTVKREVENASSLQHPHVVRLMDVFAEEENLILVWELIEGHDLLDMINKKGGRLSEPQAAFYFQQILRAVLFMHHHGYCHRDLKPENCMLQMNTQIVKLIDFGLSKHLDSAVTLGIGTPDYMAPELLTSLGGRGQKTGGYNPKAIDTWALGVLLYLLVTGKYPFEDRKNPHNVAGTVMNIKFNRMHDLPTSISAGCKYLIYSMLEKDPHNRMALKQVLKNKWLKEQSLEYYNSNKDLMSDVELESVLPMSWLQGTSDSSSVSYSNSTTSSKSSRGSLLSFKSSGSSNENSEYLKNQVKKQQQILEEEEVDENNSGNSRSKSKSGNQDKRKGIKSLGSFLQRFRQA